MSAAQRDILPLDNPLDNPQDGSFERSAEPQPTLWPASDPALTSGLRQQVAERLAAHRARRAKLGPVATPQPNPSRSNRPNAIAAAVAERYAHSPSYRSVLAEEAERATRHAAAAAEVAARNAAAIANAEQQLLQELELWDTPLSGPIAVEPEPKSMEPAAPSFVAAVKAAPVKRQVKVEAASPELPLGSANLPVSQTSTGGITVRLYEDLGPATATAAHINRTTSAAPDAEEFLTLDEEIAFRQSPIFEEPAGPTVPIPANLLEFPRQLVAARKARPMLALGPLLETTPAPSNQLRIFEVEPEQISSEPAAHVAVSEWTSIYLDTPPTADIHVAVEVRPELSAAPSAPQVASLNRRLMSAIVDATLVLAAFVAFSSAIISRTESLPLGLPLVLAAFATLAIFAVIYYLLFFTFSNGTPGMSYARIGLCTFSDENPTRAQMRRRLIPTVLALCPLGLGFLWAILDQDHMGWHDRMSQTYQREY